MEEIKTFQKYFPAFLATANISGAKFGKMVGLTRQSIHNYKRGLTKLDKAHYIAFRLCIEALAYDDEGLQNLMHSVLDKYNVTGHWLSRAMYLY